MASGPTICWHSPTTDLFGSVELSNESLDDGSERQENTDPALDKVKRFAVQCRAAILAALPLDDPVLDTFQQVLVAMSRTCWVNISLIMEPENGPT